MYQVRRGVGAVSVAQELANQPGPMPAGSVPAYAISTSYCAQNPPAPGVCDTWQYFLQPCCWESQASYNTAIAYGISAAPPAPTEAQLAALNAGGDAGTQAYNELENAAMAAQQAADAAAVQNTEPADIEGGLYQAGQDIGDAAASVSNAVIITIVLVAFGGVLYLARR